MAEKEQAKKEQKIQYGPCLVECSCGNKFETKSTLPHIHVEICSACHPFYTGKQKLVDTAGRVTKYMARVEAAQKAKENLNKKISKKNQVNQSPNNKPGSENILAEKQK